MCRRCAPPAPRDDHSRHGFGTVGDRGARSGRIPAAARAHNPARGLQQPRGPTRVPHSPGARVCSARGRARGQPDGRRRRERARKPAHGCGWLNAAHCGAGRGDETSTCARLSAVQCQHVGRRAGRRSSRPRKRTIELVEPGRGVRSSRPEGQVHGETNPTPPVRLGGSGTSLWTLARKRLAAEPHG